MKKNICIYSLVFISLFMMNSLEALSNSYSMRYADSYFSRAKASSALHWNPARIGVTSTLDIPIINTNINLSNNLFDLDMNGISGKYLTEEDKEDLLSEIDGSFVVDGNVRMMIFGFSKNNHAYSMGINNLVKAKLTEEFIRIALYGTETDNYHFTERDFGYNALSYVDFTAGYGGYKISNIIPRMNEYNIPEIEYGFSISLLAGIANVKTADFTADYLSTMEEGLSTNANLQQKEGFGGVGMKMNFSINSHISERLTAGMGFDNIFGFIKWTGKTRIRENRYWIDGVYISDLEDDILSDDDSVNDTDGYTTNLPLIYRLGTLYNLGKIDFSFDYSHSFDKNKYNLGRNSIAIASEMRWLAHFPLSLGIKFGDGDNSVSTAYGVSFKSRFFETGLSVQLADTIIPGPHSKSVSFGINSQIRFN